MSLVFIFVVLYEVSVSVRLEMPGLVPGFCSLLTTQVILHSYDGDGNS